MCVLSKTEEEDVGIRSKDSNWSITYFQEQEQVNECLKVQILFSSSITRLPSSRLAGTVLPWNQGLQSHSITFVTVQTYHFFSKQVSRLCHKLSYLLSLFCFVVLESLELFGLMHVSSFASIIKNINELICVKYLKHGRHLININFLFSAWVSGPTHYFSLENLRGEIGSNRILQTSIKHCHFLKTDVLLLLEHITAICYSSIFMNT